MDTNSDQAMQYFSMANKHREANPTTVGDFASSEELNQHLRKAMEMKEQLCGGLGMNPFSQQMGESAKEVVSRTEKVPVQAQAMSSKGSPLSPPAMAQSFEKQVLMEPCPVNTPLNASLREAYTKGNFYFLTKGK